MEYIECLAKDLTADQKRACRNLSRRTKGEISFWLTNPDTRIVLALDDGVMVGWGARLRSPYMDRKNPKVVKFLDGDTGYFVRKSHRRRGIGSAIFHLLNSAKYATDVYVYPHNKESASFFYAVGAIDVTDARVYGADAKIKPKRRQKVLKDVHVKKLTNV